MRKTVAKALRKEAVKRGFTKSQFRAIKKKYNRLKHVQVEVGEGEEKKMKWLSVLQQKKALCLS